MDCACVFGQAPDESNRAKKLNRVPNRDRLIVDCLQDVPLQEGSLHLIECGFEPLDVIGVVADVLRQLSYLDLVPLPLDALIHCIGQEQVECLAAHQGQLALLRIGVHGIYGLAQFPAPVWLGFHVRNRRLLGFLRHDQTTGRAMKPQYRLVREVRARHN